MPKKPSPDLKYPPGPRRWLPRGYNYLLELATDTIGFLKKLSTYGDIVFFDINGYRSYVLNNPDLVREVLVTHQKNFSKGNGANFIRYLVGNGLLTSEGDFWLRQRRMIQPAFHRKQIAHYAKIMVDYADLWAKRWQPGELVDAKHEMMGLTLAVVAKSLFDADITNDKEMSEALDAMHKWSNRATLPLKFSQFLQKLPLPTTLRFNKALQHFDATVYGLIRERRASGENKGDLLSMLIAAQDELVAGEAGRMTDEQIHDEIITFFLAGHETTALTLTWLWETLGQHPEIEAKLHEELDRVLGDRLPTFDDYSKLTYTEMVVSEALRMYPPAYAMSRHALTDIKLGDYLIPANSSILVAPYILHHNPKYYPDPEKFIPERFTPEAKAKRPKNSFFPFSVGPRLCIGEPFAWMEAVLMLATLAQRWRLRPAEGFARPGLGPRITLNPDGPAMMRLEPRQPKVTPPTAEKEVAVVS
jgi:cytochrome P450